MIGDPIAHSLSPLMHNEELEKLKVHAYYHPFHIRSDHLQTAIEGMKVIGVAGFNVTIPHKTAIIPLLDEIDPLAKAIGAVNTVAREQDRLIGYNTDGSGFVQALIDDWKEDLTDERTLIIGAGGASKAIYYTLLSLGVKQIDICNRTLERAEQLIQDCPYEGKSQAFSLQEAEAQLDDYSLVIQTTSIGMFPQVEYCPLSLKNLSRSAFVSDIIYNPAETAFLKGAREKGAQIQNGLGMFVYQGALAFKKWTGMMPEVDRMKQTVINYLGGN